MKKLTALELWEINDAVGCAILSIDKDWTPTSNTSMDDLKLNLEYLTELLEHETD